MKQRSFKNWLKMGAIAVIFTIFSTLSCSKSSQTSHFRGFAMKMPYHIAIVGPLTRHDKVVIKRIIEGTFQETDQISNHWNNRSELSYFNQMRSTKNTNLSPSLRELLTLAAEIVRLSEGRYDPTLGPVIDSWKTSLVQHREPSHKTLVSLKRVVGWEHLTFTDNKIAKDIPELTLDLDSIAKGKCVDNITTNLVEAGYENVYVEWSGEIRTHGNNEEKTPWAIEIFSPRSGPRDVIHLENEAIATSGNYMQSWAVRSEDDGNVRIYSHLINRKTLRSMELQKKSILSVSVRAPTCALADGLATAAMLIETPEELIEWTNKIKNEIHGVTFWIVEKQVL